MAQHDHHPVPYVKELAREKPFLSSEEQLFVGVILFIKVK